MKSYPDPIYRSYRRQVFWQILLPLLVLTVVVLLVFSFVVMAGGSSLRLFADVALIVLLVPLLFVALGGIVLLGLAVAALGWLARRLPYYAAPVRSQVERGQVFLHRLADGSVQPVFWVQQAGAILRQIVQAFRVWGRY